MRGARWRGVGTGLWDSMDRACQVKTVSSRLQWREWERYSNSTRDKNGNGRIYGGLEYEGVILSEFLSLITAGEIPCVGPGTVFGLGRYGTYSR